MAPACSTSCCAACSGWTPKSPSTAPAPPSSARSSSMWATRGWPRSGTARTTCRRPRRSPPPARGCAASTADRHPWARVRIRVRKGPAVNPSPRTNTSRDEDPATLTLQSVAGYLDLMSRATPAPAAGSAAALAIGMGAALAGKTARLSANYREDTDELAHTADDIRKRAVALADADSHSVARAVPEGSTSQLDMSAVPRRIGDLADAAGHGTQDRKSTRLNSSHVATSYAVFCLKKKKT